MREDHRRRKDLRSRTRGPVAGRHHAEAGRVVDFGLAVAEREAIVASGLPFRTSDCPGKTRDDAVSTLVNAGLAVDFVSPKAIRATLQDCDVLFVVGAPVFQLIFPEPDQPVLGKRTKLVQLDCYTHEIGKNVRPEIALLGDPKAGLAELSPLTLTATRALSAGIVAS